MENRPVRGNRSLFWPIVLIGLGVIWLFANLGLIQGNNLGLLASLWPLILVGIGLDLLLGRGSPIRGAAIGILLVGAVVVLLVSAPVLGIQAPGSELKTDHFQAPLQGTSTADVRITSGSEPVNLYALSNSDQLIDATIVHYGSINFDVSGTSDKTISLSHGNSPAVSFNFFSSQQQRWDVGLAPQVPTRLQFHSGSGSVKMNLNGVQLSAFSLNSGSGSVDVTLPTVNKAYTVESHSGSGSLHIALPANTDLTLRTDSGSGSLNLSLPTASAVRVEVTNSGSGSLNVSSRLTRISGDEKQGTWESQGYGQAAHKILIQVTGRGSGSVNIQ